MLKAVFVDGLTEPFLRIKRPSGTMEVIRRISLLVHNRKYHIHHTPCKYFKPRGKRTGIVRTCKTQRNRIYMRLGKFNVTIHSFIYFPFTTN